MKAAGFGEGELPPAENGDVSVSVSTPMLKHGALAARAVFKKRGNRTEAHLDERELGAIIAAACELAPRKVRVIHDSDPSHIIEIAQYLHCALCLSEWQAGFPEARGKTPAEYARTQAGLTKTGIQVVCTRHNVNITHMTLTAVGKES